MSYLRFVPFKRNVAAAMRVMGCAAALLSAVPSAKAALFAVDANQDVLYQVNPATGAVTAIGTTALSGLTTPGGLAWDGTSMYTIDLEGGELFTLDLATGTPTLVGTNGLNGWQGLAARPTDGALFAVTQTNTLYSINKTTGAATAIGSGTGALITALTFNAGGVLWGINFFDGQFGTIDTATGAFTAVGTTDPGFQGLSFDSTGTAYVSNSNTDTLYTLDLGTGAATLVGAMTGTSFVKAIEFTDGGAVPEPGSLALIGLGAMGLAVLRMCKA